MAKSPSHQSAKCKYSSWAWPFGRNQPMCELAYRVTEPSIVAATFGGHARDNHVYVAVSYDRDRPQRGPQYLLAHTYSTAWENFGSHRTAFVTAGSHTTGAVDWGCRMCGSLNGAGLSHIVIPAEVGAAQVFRATRGWGFSAGNTPTRVTRATINLPFNSLVFAQTSGHYINHCIIAITFDRKGNIVGREGPRSHPRDRARISANCLPPMFIPSEASFACAPPTDTLEPAPSQRTT